MTEAAGVRCMIMRGGTSKGAYFVADDLPADPTERDRVLIEIMGTPDARQIDGIGGAHPLTSKVAIVGPSTRAGTDVDYLFLQLGVDQATVSDRQNCGNLLAGVGPFAVERGLVSAGTDSPGQASVDTKVDINVDINMVNTGSVATATFAVESGRPVYRGDTEIAGVPGTAAPIRLDFADLAGGSCGSLLPTGRPVDQIAGVAVTLIDNGMPVVVMAASDVGIEGHEDCTTLETDPDLRELLERIRLQAGPMMNLGDVASTTVPKLTMVGPPRSGGDLTTRTFIPHRCHEAIGVLGAVSVATAALIPDTAASRALAGGQDGRLRLEHPTGIFEASVELEFDDGLPVVKRAGIIRTARKLMDGAVFARSY